MIETNFLGLTVLYELTSIDFDMGDIELIKNLVQDADPFITPPLAIENPYELLTYISANISGTPSLWALLDNNFLSDVVKIARNGNILSGSKPDIGLQKTSAIMCFLILGGIELEPSFSIYEKAEKAGHASAYQDFIDFRIADHIHPQIYADLALGRITTIDRKDLDKARDAENSNPVKINENNFTRELRNWQVQYIAILKAIIFYKSENNSLQAALSFVDWMHEETFLNRTGLLFALALLGTKKNLRLLKHINSKDLSQIISSCRNSAWDLSYIKEWSKRVIESPSDRLCYLITHDKVLKKFAQSIFIDEGASEHSRIISTLSEFWQKSDAIKITNHLLETIKQIENNPEQRRHLFLDRYSNVDSTCRELETELAKVLKT